MTSHVDVADGSVDDIARQSTAATLTSSQSVPQQQSPFPLPQRIGRSNNSPPAHIDSLMSDHHGGTSSASHVGRARRHQSPATLHRSQSTDPDDQSPTPRPVKRRRYIHHDTHHQSNSHDMMTGALASHRQVEEGADDNINTPPMNGIGADHQDLRAALANSLTCMVNATCALANAATVSLSASAPSADDDIIRYEQVGKG